MGKPTRAVRQEQVPPLDVARGMRCARDDKYESAKDVVLVGARRPHRSTTRPTALRDPLARQQAINDHDQRDDQQRVNQPTADVYDEKAECPENEEDKYQYDYAVYCSACYTVISLDTSELACHQ